MFFFSPKEDNTSDFSTDNSWINMPNDELAIEFSN